METPQAFTQLFGSGLRTALEWEWLTVGSGIGVAKGPMVPPPEGVAANSYQATVMAASEECFYDEVANVFDDIGSSLNFSERGAWQWQRLLIQNRLQAFFSGLTDVPGIVLVLPYRSPIWDRSRALGFEVLPPVVEAVRPLANMQAIRHIPIQLGCGLGELSREERQHMIMAPRSEHSPTQEMQLVCIEHRLIYQFGDRTDWIKQNLFVAAHMSLDAADLHQARNPSLKEWSCPQSGFVGTAQILLAKLTSAGEVLDFRIDLNVRDAKINGMTSQTRPLYLFRLDRGNQLDIGFGLPLIASRLDSPSTHRYYG